MGQEWVYQMLNESLTSQTASNFSRFPSKSVIAEIGLDKIYLSIHKSKEINIFVKYQTVTKVFC